MFFNELVFLSHVIFVVMLTVFALRLGRGVLVSLVVLQAVLANVFVLKQTTLFGFSVTCSDVFAVGGILALNLLQEFHGRAEAAKALKASFFGLIFFVIMSKFHLAYLPAVGDAVHGAFASILSNTLRISLASIAVYFVTQAIDLRLFSFLKKVFQGKYLPFRVGLSLGVTQLLDTVLFTLFGLYGIISNLLDVIILSFCVKLLIISCSSFLISFSRRLVKSAEV